MSYDDDIGYGYNETSSIEGHIDLAQEKIRQFSVFLDGAEYKKMRDNGRENSEDTERKLKKKLKREMRKWKSKEEEILNKIFELKNDMKVELRKIERERDKSRTRNIKRKRHGGKVKRKVSICGKCCDAKSQFVREIMRRQPSNPIGWESAEKLKRQRRQRIKEKYSDSSSDLLEESTFSVENLELSSMYEPRKFLRNQSTLELMQEENHTDEIEQSSYDLSNIDETMAERPVKRRTRFPPEPCASENNRNFIRKMHIQNKNNYNGGLCPKSKTYDVDSRVFEELNRRIMKLTEGESDAQLDYSTSNHETGTFNREASQESSHPSNRRGVIEIVGDKQVKIIDSRKPLAFEISINVKNPKENLTLKQAFQAYKPDLRNKIDNQKRMQEERILKTDKKFHRNAEGGPYKYRPCGKRRRSKENKRRCANQEDTVAHDLTSDTMYKKFIQQKRQEQEELEDRMEGNHQGASHRKRRNLESWSRNRQSNETKENDFTPKSKGKRKKSVPRIRDPSQKLKLRKNYDERIRKRNRRKLSRRSQTPVTNPKELIKDYQTTLKAIQKELENFY